MTKKAGLAATFTLLALALTAGIAVAAEAAPVEAPVETPVEVTEPTVIGKFQVAPVYPPAAQMARFEGSVTIAAAVDKDGAVSEVAVVECDHRNLGFEQAALDAVGQWKFRPARVGDEPIEAVTYIRLHFNSRRASRGYVSGGMVASSIGIPAIGGVGKNLRGVGAGQGTAASDGGERVQHVRFPGAGLGELYDRRNLIPASSTLIDLPPSPLPGTGGGIGGGF